MADDSSKKLFEIFFPYANSRLNKIKKDETRFVHYTSAATAFEIIRSKEFWLREPSCMNDFSEVEHGMRCISNIYSRDKIGIDCKRSISPVGKRIEIPIV